jgi:DNA-directed RNA polymerase II subunit RPB1
MNSSILGIQFSILSPDEIRKSSVAEITSKDTYVNNKTVVGGMFDSRMGILEPGLICPTDGLDYIQCPGYFGHIELAKPVFYIQYLDTVVNIIQSICIKCSKLLIDKKKYHSLLSLSNDKRWKQVHALCHKVTRCGESSETGCGCKQPTKYKHEGFATIVAEWKMDGAPVSLKITPEMFIKIFRRISDEDIAFMGFSPVWSRPEWMICQVLAVPPPAVRPSVKYDSSQRSEDDLTYLLVQIIRTNKTLQEKIAQNVPPATIDDYHTMLQYFVATMIDNKIPNAKPAAQRSGRAFKSIKDRLNGKTGRVRGNLMGKRVDFSARSVITPDPNLSIRELGVPVKIAQNITKPVTVNSRNIHMLTTLLKNGPDVYPGAKLLERVIHGKSVHISLKYADRESIELHEGDILHRHMLDGDAILFNRQPTLHRMSMMGHIVRVMKQGNTFRMNVGDTKPYNADFDGDEMNLHMPQSLEAETELKHLAAVPYQILSPASNQSIIGIFQDSLLGCFQFTREQDLFGNPIHFDPLTAMNLVVNLTKVDERIFQQDSVKNTDLMSLILPPMTSYQKNNLYKDSENGATSNNIVEIVNGVYRRGRLDKGTLSATSKGLIHRIFNDYGNFASADFIDNIQYIVNEYMKLSSYSVGISDLIMSQDTQDKIKEAIRAKKVKVDELIAQTQFGAFVNETGKSNSEELESRVNIILGEANTQAGKLGKESLSPTNRFALMVQAGSKGSDINISQMVSCLGQQQVEGKRIPYGFDHRTLPHFTKYNDTSSARGFVESSFIGGLNPYELFFHAQGGRIGLIDTAVKTATTGYIQRRLIKAMEDCISLYDGTVRNNKNKIIQFSYGEDNIDPARVETFHLPLCDMKIEQIYHHYNMNVDDLFLFSGDTHQRYKAQHSECMDRCKYWIDFMIESRNQLIRHVFDFKNEYKIRIPVGIPYLISHIANQFMLSPQIMVDLTPFETFQLLDKYYAKLEGLGTYKPSLLFKIMYYYSLSPRELLIHKHFTKSALIMLLEQIVMHYKRSLIQPGEMVGIIAAQSIGEPTTQMTLNTFHFAGVASKSNATRGVPRIEEILSLSANPKSPSVTIYLKEVDETNKERAHHFMNMIEHTKLADIVNKIDIIFDPKNETIQEDRAFIRQHEEFDELLVDCVSVQASEDTPWVIRIVMNEEEMLNKKITMDDVNFAIKQSGIDMSQCIYSDYNADKLVFRIRPLNPKKKLVKNRSVFFNMDYVYNLKEVQTKLLNVVLRGVKNIQKVNIRTVKNNVKWVNGNYETQEIWVLDTMGTNLLDIMGLDYIDATKTTSNDIKETYDVLGVEAARECIYAELTEVIEFDGAYINDHHKSLLCDRMACTHPLTSIFRHGVNADDIGPIAKASFEETPEMFLKAARHAELDNMRGVSANVMCGQEGFYGTNSFSLLLDMQKMTELTPLKVDEKKHEIVFGKDSCDQIQIHNNLGTIVETKRGESIDYMIEL